MSLKPLPLADDRSCLIFGYSMFGYMVLDTIGQIVRHRYHVPILRAATWGFPVAVGALYLVYPIVPEKSRQAIWSFGMRGHFWIHHDTEQDEHLKRLAL